MTAALVDAVVAEEQERDAHHQDQHSGADPMQDLRCGGSEPSADGGGRGGEGAGDGIGSMAHSHDGGWWVVVQLAY